VSWDVGDHRRTAGTVAIAAAGTALCAISAGVTFAGSDAEYAWLEALARATMVGAPLAVGVYAWRRPASERFGVLLMLAGVCWFLTTLSESSDPLVYSIGRLAAWITEPVLLYLVLAFPTGRLHARVDRALLAASMVLVAVLYLPPALVVERFPEPAPWTLCHGGCPENAFMLVDSQPAVIEELVRPLRELLVILLFAAASVRVALRIRAATPLMRRVLAPLLWVASFRLACFAAALLARRIDADGTVVAASMWSLSLTVPLLAVAFLVGLVRWRLFVGTAMARLAGRLAAHPGPDDLRDALSEAFGDPTLEIAYWVDAAGGWVDGDGAPVRPPPPGRRLTVIRDGDRRIAAVIHDEALSGEQAFVDAATAYAVLTIDNHRLGAEAAALLAEVQESRARIQASADDERRRIERDLHDGAQQRLVALRIKLELAAEQIDASDHASAELLRRLGGDVDGALDEVRSLARGIYPAPLADRGLVDGLRSAALQSALPATVLATNIRGRYAREVESAAYFCCLEAVQNAAKHATGASAVVIELVDDGVLRFEVRDDGAGFDAGAALPGVGLTSMRDRLAAVGGELAIVSSPGMGTRVVGRIPLASRPQEPVDAPAPPVPDREPLG
jgi:signal transduction histidine kinase